MWVIVTPHFTGFGDVDIYIPLRIDDGAIILSREKVRVVSNFTYEKMFEQHKISPLVSGFIDRKSKTQARQPQEIARSFRRRP